MTAPKETVRTFIAAAISPEARQALEDAAGRLRQDIPKGVGWTKSQGFHVTLKFLGNIRPEFVDRVSDSLGAPAARSTPFQLGLAGLGMFPNQRRPRVVWAGLGGDLEALSALYQAVEQAMTELGFAPEDRPYAPHITLGRVRRGASEGLLSKISSTVTVAPKPLAQPWQVDSVHLFRTDLQPSGAEHTVIGSWALGAPNAAAGRS